MKTPMEKFLDRKIDGATDDQKREGVQVQLVFKSTRAPLVGKLRRIEDGLYEMIALHEIDPKNPKAVACIRHVFESSDVAQFAEPAGAEDQPKIVKPAGGLVIPS